MDMVQRIVTHSSAFLPVPPALLLFMASWAMLRGSHASPFPPVPAMNRIVHLNGAYCPEQEARVSIFDRGLLFADSVYEVTGVLDGRLVDFPAHMQRLQRSLASLGIIAPLSSDELLAVHRELVRANNLLEGLIYLQITRGCADRDFIHEDNLTPGIFLFTQEKPLFESEMITLGARLKSVLDLRWARRDIKSTSLLAQVLAKQEAHRAGADEALLVDGDGMVNEGASSSAFIIADDAIITRPLSATILAGTTRAALLELLQARSLQLLERPFSLDEARNAQECFLTGASLGICPAVEIDGQPIGNGTPGPMARQLRELHLHHARETSL